MLLLLLACRDNSASLGSFDIEFDRKSGTMNIFRLDQEVLAIDHFAVGQGSADVEFQQGSYYFDAVEASWTVGASFGITKNEDDNLLSLELQDAAGEPFADLVLSAGGTDQLIIALQAHDSAANRTRISAACNGDDTFLGGGSHAWDVEHGGEAFPLWVSEPGIGKAETDTYPVDWYLTGTRHASSYPSPFFLRPAEPVGLEAVTGSRVEADLCATDPEQWSLVAWSGATPYVVFAGDDPLDVVENHALAAGTLAMPADWAFAPWNDAVRGADRVREVATTLRENNIPASAIWTEDWKGAEEGTFGYHLLGEWEVDETLYPDAAGLAAELEEDGFAWMAYFSPFLMADAESAAEAFDYAIRDENGDIYWFLGYTLVETTVLDLSRSDAQEWVMSKMQAALDIGFDGWMADFAEWLPTDAQMSQMDAYADHNQYPLLWQAINAEVTADTDAVFFTRSGWSGTPAYSPVTWGGDQRTSFDADDGLPSVIPLGLGLAIAGVPFYGSDIAGYQSIGNAPSDKELWFRWCTLGAFSPIMRTHHGAFDTDNWQFDSDEETIAHYARYAQEHARLFPYLRGLAEQAINEGTPLVLPPAMYFASAPWDATDAWMLGASLYVAPVLTQGATGRDVALPADTTWYDWWTGATATAGWVDADMNEIPVFVPAGSVVPVLTELPETFREGSQRRDLSDVDGQRTLRVFGSGGRFTEADGTTYTVSGAATAAGTASDTLSSGTISVGGLTVTISGETSRVYTVEAYP